MMHRIVRLLGLFVLLLPFISVADTPILTPTWAVKATFQQPESVVYDQKRQQFYLSNINGKPSEADGNGYISRLSSTGKLIDLRWVKGLNAPKGMAISGDRLYVADIKQLVVIDIASGQVIHRYSASEAKFLNDVVVDHQNGAVYVSGFLTNSIYRLLNNKFALWLQTDALEFPNGLLVNDGQLIVASWGNITDGFATKTPGHLKTVNILSRQVASLGDQTPVGNLDGIEEDGNGNYLVTDWVDGKLLHINVNGISKTLIKLDQGSADHTVVQNLIVIPIMTSGDLLAYQIKR